MKIITIGKRLIPDQQIALIEPFDPTSNPEFKPEKDFKARVILLNRDTVLTETPLEAFAEANGFYLLPGESVAVNPTLVFRVETFTPTESFRPEKGYRSRIKWRDPEGNEQSKLLVMEPEAVVFELSRRGNAAAESKKTPERPARKRRSARSAEAAKAEQ
jgi:hypothetical protein